MTDAPTPPFEVRLHGALWKEVGAARAAEWRRSLDEVNAHNALRARPAFDLGDEPALELLRRPEGHYCVRLYRDGTERAHEVALDPQQIAGFFAEYAATIERMVHVDREAPARGFETLDYAKRLVHDEAAGWLRDAMDACLACTLDDARRLFTLLFLVGTDLPEALVRYHRRHGGVRIPC